MDHCDEEIDKALDFFESDFDNDNSLMALPIKSVVKFNTKATRKQYSTDSLNDVMRDEESFINLSGQVIPSNQTLTANQATEINKSQSSITSEIPYSLRASENNNIITNQQESESDALRDDTSDTRSLTSDEETSNLDPVEASSSNKSNLIIANKSQSSSGSEKWPDHPSNHDDVMNLLKNWQMEYLFDKLRGKIPIKIL